MPVKQDAFEALKRAIEGAGLGKEELPVALEEGEEDKAAFSGLIHHIPIEIPPFR